MAAARTMIERDGVEGLSMRKVSAEVGLAPTAVYWHLGGRDELLNAVLDEVLGELPPIRATGRTSRARIGSIVRSARRDFLEGMPVLLLANEVGRGDELSYRTQLALAEELGRAGLDGHEAADVLRALLFVVGGFVMIEEQYRTGEADDFATAGRWADGAAAEVPPALRAAMARPPDADALFAFTLDRLLDAVLPPD
ncbi:MAG: helix-turn-helix transcriptional regulator [Acidimicrobiales bacterium]|nr:helix-turn-helix transcriptional regulator [Acidimicrobiales bacterium]MCB9371534.1 helix-turn-helix transcriptional regulator [Microthrixaceae bacterium]